MNKEIQTDTCIKRLIKCFIYLFIISTCLNGKLNLIECKIEEEGEKRKNIKVETKIKLN